MSRWRVGVDSGGTFTDICLFDEQAGRIETWKVPSTPDDPSRGIAQGVEEGMRRVAPEAKDRPAAPIVWTWIDTAVVALLAIVGGVVDVVARVGAHDCPLVVVAAGDVVAVRMVLDDLAVAVDADVVDHL